MQSKKRGVRVWITLVACVLECFLFAGSIFGWPSMAYILQQDGIFVQRCPNDTYNANKTNDLKDLKVNNFKVSDIEVTNINVTDINVTSGPAYDLHKDTGCDDQRSSIALAFTFATIVLGFTTFLNGIIFDKYGLRVTRCSATGIAVSGHLMLAFAAPHRLSYLIYPGCIFVGISCSIYIMTSFHICLLAGSRSSTWSAVNSGSVNSGASVFLIIKLLYGLGFARKYGLFCLCALYAYSLFITFFLLPAKKVYTKIAIINTEEINAKADTEESAFTMKSVSEKRIDDHGLLKRKNQPENHMETQQNKEKGSELRQILTSSYFLLHLFWYSMVHLRVAFFCSSFNTWVEHLTSSNEEVSLLTNSYGYIQLCTGLITPFAGLLVDYLRRKIIRSQKPDAAHGVIRKDLSRAVIPPLAIASLSATSLCICTLLHSKNAVWAGCFFVEITRSFVYVTLGTYISLTFPADRFGVLFGIAYATGGLTTGLQYGLLEWSVAWNDFFYPNLVLMLFILLTLVHPANIYIRHLCARRSRLK